MSSAGETQRWAETRMIIRRLSNGRMMVSLIHRRVDGQRIWDRRTDVVEVPLSPGDPASVDVLEALRLAVQALGARRAGGDYVQGSGPYAPPPA